MTRAIMHGCNGKMGQVITGLIAQDEDVKIVAGIDTYDEKKNDVIFSCGLFFLYHLGIPVLHPGNSLACAVVTGYLSNYEKQYQQAILQLSLIHI